MKEGKLNTNKIKGPVFLAIKKGSERSGLDFLGPRI